MSAKIDLLAHEVRANPYDTYAIMRDKYPVCKVDPGGLWAIARYEDVKASLKNHAVFSSEGFRFLLGPEWLSDSPLAESMLAADPPDHTKLRSLVNKAFTPKVINELAGLMERVAQQRVEAIQRKQTVELLEDFTFPYISEIIGRILGFDLDMHCDIKRWVDALAFLGPEKPTEAAYLELEEIQSKISAYCNQIIKDRRSNPRKDLISTVVNSEIEGNSLSDRECLCMVQLLISGGFDTTNILITNCIRQLSLTPELVDVLYSNRELLPAFIDEVMRYDPPTHALIRQAKEDVELSGVCIPKGDFVYLMLGSAGRDGDHYQNPDKFDIYRQDADNLSFGHGAHVCIGMMLARMEVKVALNQLIETYSRFSCPRPEDIEWSTAIAGRSVVSLPLSLSLRGL